MGRYCSVPGCRNKKGGHLYPTTPQRMMKWRVAVKRIDQTTKKLWMPRENDVVCRDHFMPQDYCQNKRKLKDGTGTVPSVFSFVDTNPIPSQTARDLRAEKKTVRELQAEKRNSDQLLPLDDIAKEVIIEEIESEDSISLNSIPSRSNASVQCYFPPVTSTCLIQNFQEKDDAVQYLSGFDNYQHFMWFFGILKHTGVDLSYECTLLSRENQLFLVLMKLRQGFDHKFLGILFDISEATVSKVFSSWINFLYKCLKLLYTWPSKKVVKETMPDSFKKTYPATRIIIDSTEIPIEKPSDINLQRRTFSTYKNRNTLKVLVGITPRGVVSFVGECYGGSASDREIIELSDLYTQVSTLFEDGDVIMADRGFLVQDLFAPHNVAVNTPSLLKGKSQLESNTRYADQKIASQRVHVERVIGYAKTYKILQSAIPYKLLYLSNKIVYICFMLTNYRRAIVTE